MEHLKTIRRWLPILVLALLVGAGAVLRLHGLADFSIGHIEMSVPGIPLPYGMSIPSPAFSFRETIAGVLVVQDPNPPGYYLLMLAWTRLFGTGILALRLPSVLSGLACIPAVYALAVKETGRCTGLLAAAMLAFSGYQVLWSQFAKMYILGCLLALLSSMLLLDAWRAARGRRIFGLLYGAVSLVGLATVFYYWFVFFTQILWVLLASWGRRKSMPCLLQVQLITFILASPLLGLAVFQARRPSYLCTQVLPLVVQYLQFGFLFTTENFDIPPLRLPPAAGGLVVLLALGLLARRSPVQDRAEAAGPEPGLPPFVSLLAGLLSLLVCLKVADVTASLDRVQTRWVIALSPLPLLLAGVDFMLRRRWQNLTRQAHLPEGLLQRLRSLPLFVWLAILPVLVIVGMTPLVALFAPRTMLMFTPFLLILLARGFGSLVQKDRRWALLAPALVTIFGANILFNQGLVRFPNDYKGLAEKWAPEIQASDLIFTRFHWITTPIFYYLNADRYHYVQDRFADAIQAHPGSRIWVLSFPGVDTLPEISQAVQDYQKIKMVSALNIRASLYVPKGGGP